MNQNKKTKKSFGADDPAPLTQEQQEAKEAETIRRARNIIEEDTDDEGDDEDDKRRSKRRKTEKKMCTICLDEITDKHGLETDGYVCDCKEPLHEVCLTCMQKLQRRFALHNDLQCPTCRGTCKRISLTGYPGKGKIAKINVIFSTHEKCKLEIRQVPDAKLMQKGDDGRWIPKPLVKFDQFDFIKTITQNLLTRNISTKESKISWEHEVFTDKKRAHQKKSTTKFTNTYLNSTTYISKIRTVLLFRSLFPSCLSTIMGSFRQRSYLMQFLMMIIRYLLLQILGYGHGQRIGGGISLWFLWTSLTKTNRKLFAQFSDDV